MFGTDRFQEILNKNITRPVLLYGDPDLDGLLSLYLMIRWFTKYFPDKKYQYYVNDKRSHDFGIEPSKLSGYLVISADFHIDRAKLQEIVDADVAIISTDHHEIEKDFVDVHSATAEGIIINNQYPFEPQEDRYLSGAGVWYELICSMYPDFKSKELEALVGVTLLSDIRDISGDKARAYLRTTYTRNTNDEGYINYLVNTIITEDGGDFGFGLPRLDRNFIDFRLSPFINSLLRFDKKDEAVDFILQKGLRIGSHKAMQKDLVERMISSVIYKEFVNLDIIVIDAMKFSEDKVTPSNFVGLVASSWMDSHGRKSVLALCIENGKVLRTSFRGKYADVHYRNGFRNLGLKAEGHAGAFGLISFEPTTEIFQQIDDIVGDMEANHQPTITILEVSNLAIFLNQKGVAVATENCYCNDEYRTYVRYTGSNIKQTKITFKTIPYTNEDKLAGIKPDGEVRGAKYKYVRDSSGMPVPKFISYLVDGREVKSFGVPVDEGLILPILDKGNIQLQVRSMIS